MPVSGLATSTFFPVPSRDLRGARPVAVDPGEESNSRLAESRREAVTLDLDASGEFSPADASRTVDAAASADNSFFQSQSSFDELPTDCRNALSLYVETAQLSTNQTMGNAVVGVDMLV